MLAGEARIEDLLALPPEPTLPPADYVSTKNGWRGRNSDPELCKDITIPPPEEALSVDQLLERGRAVSFDCDSASCPTVRSHVFKQAVQSEALGRKY